MSYDLVPQLPRVTLSRRLASLSLDAGLIWLILIILFDNWLTRMTIFMMGWVAMRVFLVAKNQGQSLGRWAFDLRVLDTRFKRTPRLLELFKREALLGFATVLALEGLTGLTSRNASVLLLLLPLLFDWVVALVDLERHKQALHDRLGGTIVVGTMRGYSLDLKIRWLIDKIINYVRR